MSFLELAMAIGLPISAVALVFSGRELHDRLTIRQREREKNRELRSFWNSRHPGD
ncbi:hypothetical protein [Deinococcus peraridilitoris]|uniref:Uncharacterized protein n=1 Tax=Deinococcus peraridilitoris (strain DSM 19664 / LMG 22246 / CIP 109416 / KR-200) TaxID=937777 RepID=L0A7W4_DEIPD|nr:hypothetical protein [Deinococcus peraridilitoris]AFZ69529.1 hypothetical protein Deipe_4162 [Deinococcus peraridilitoris DSM 19664]